ncbi:hypothetical protein ElyMa_006971500 [Elysia marginata]|uniref:XRN2-binding (XTBD) domain-containing protein n=1 Tax=Elysia marginata TaxID=1093978 RepID=A0AAV4JK52_9GAST|nr:hypothetical protein ElyMa_006971500 [Elysia marginata]
MASEVKKESVETSMFPRLPIFSGEDKDTDFDVWHFDVKCLIQEQRWPNRGCRRLCLKTVKLHPKGCHAEDETNKLLKEAFEGGLQRATRAATAYLFTTDIPFDQLQVEVKRKERELGLLQPVTGAAAQDTQFNKLAAQINNSKRR